KNICDPRGWALQQVRFYTGVPKLEDSPYWHNFWAAKRRFLSRDNRIKVFTRDIHYRDRLICFREEKGRVFLETDNSTVYSATKLVLPNGKVVHVRFWWRKGEENGIDVRIAVDMISMIYRLDFDIGILFTQDQDLSEAVTEVRAIARDKNHPVQMFCAFP